MNYRLHMFVGVLLLLVCGDLLAAGEVAQQPATRPVVASLEKAKEVQRELLAAVAETIHLRRYLQAKGMRPGMSDEEADQWLRSLDAGDKEIELRYALQVNRCRKLAMRVWLASCQPCALPRVPRRNLPERLEEVAKGFGQFLDSRPAGMSEEDVWQGIGQTIELVNSDYAGPAWCVLLRWLDSSHARALPTHWEGLGIKEPGRTALYRQLVAWRAHARKDCYYSTQWERILGPQGVGHDLVDLRGVELESWPPPEEKDGREFQEPRGADGK